MTEQLAEEIFRTAADSIAVLPPPYDAVVDRAREQRRHRRRVVAASVAAALVVVGLGTWAGTRPPAPADRQPTHVVPLRNPVSSPWYASGRLHLRAVAVDIADVTDVAGIGEGAVYLDESGDIGVVDLTGRTDVVGSAVPGSRVLGSADSGWAVWVHPAEDGTRIVVWSMALDDVLATTPVDAGTDLVAIDQDRVYYQDDSGAFSWAAAQTGAEPEPLGPPQLADVRSATRVYQRGHRIEMVQPLFSVSFGRRGDGAAVSPGGSFVLSRRPEPWEPGTPYTPILYDARSGRRLPTGIEPDERVVDAAFGQHQDITYLVANVADLSGATLDGDRSALLVLRTCELESASCHDVLPVQTDGGPAMFAD